MRFSRWTGVALASSMIAGLLVSPAGAAVPGHLDTTFDGDGRVTIDFAGVGPTGAIAILADMAIQADGRIVAVGSVHGPLVDGVATDSTHSEFALARYNRDGTLDPTFGDGGRITTDFAGYASASAVAVAIQADGRIVAAGATSTEFGSPSESPRDIALARYNSDGTLDATFGDDGRVTDAGPGNVVTDMALQSDGRIIVAGGASTGTSLDFALARYNPDGTLDSGFGGDGRVTTDFAGDFDHADAVAIQADGRIVAGGVTITGSDWEFGLARYNSDGTLDTTFGEDGKVTTGGVFGDVVIQTNGKIVAAGSESDDFALTRYNSDGTLDATFGEDGKVTTDFLGTNERVNALEIQADGKIVAAGYTLPGTDFGLADFALARYNPDGTLDTTLHGDGRITTDFGGDMDIARAVAIQADGKIVAAGSAGGQFALARYKITGSAQARIDPPGHRDANHCHARSGADLNVVSGVPEQFVHGPCGQVTVGAHWRPLSLWFVSPTIDSFPPGYLPTADTPLEDLVAKLEAVKVVIDPGTRRESTVVLSPAEALRTDVTGDQYDDEVGAYPMAVTIPRIGPLPVGEHTVQLIWVLSAMHCDGLGTDVAANCLPAGDVSRGLRSFTVITP